MVLKRCKNHVKRCWISLKSTFNSSERHKEQLSSSYSTIVSFIFILWTYYWFLRTQTRQKCLKVKHKDTFKLLVSLFFFHKISSSIKQEKQLKDEDEKSFILVRRSAVWASVLPAAALVFPRLFYLLTAGSRWTLDMTEAGCRGQKKLWTSDSAETARWKETQRREGGLVNYSPGGRLWEGELREIEAGPDRRERIRRSGQIWLIVSRRAGGC